MEEGKSIKPIWAISRSIDRPMYVSADNLLVAYEHFMKTIPISGVPVTYHFETLIRIGSFCTLPELGLIALNDLNNKGQTVVLQYPEMDTISVLKGTYSGAAPEMSFLGLEFLLFLYFDSKYHFELWRWKTGEKMDALSASLADSKAPSLSVRVHPLWWYQVAVQSSVQMMFLEVKKSDGYNLELSCYHIEDDKDELKLRMDWNSKMKRSSMEEQSHPLSYATLQKCCWLPGEKIVIATSSGIFKAGLGEQTLQKVGDARAIVSSMVYNGSNFYISYKTGEIDVVDLEGDMWRVKETIIVDQKIANTFLSPDCKYMTVTTLEKGIINYRIDSGDHTIASNISDTEFGKVIGVGMLGLGLSHCVVAEKNGTLHIIRSINGGIVSNFKMEEEISCIACSPLCSLILVGSSTGYLYFIDCVKPEKPRIVLCENPYDQPIRQLKFDNFGRYVVASARKQPVKIWRAGPSSGFAGLGSIKMDNVVRDFSVFCRTSKDSTYLFVLAENESKKSVVLRFQLPADFTTQFKQYHKDMFENLSTKALNIQTLTLDCLYARVEVYEKYGILFLSCPSSVVQSFSAWTNFEKAQTRDLIKSEDATKCCLSLNHHWLAIIDNFSCIKLYKSDDLSKVVASTRKLTIFRSTDKSYLEFPLFINNLLCGRRNGSVLCYGWTGDSQYTQFIPEWILHCFNNFEANNKCLTSMDREEKVDVIPQTNFPELGSDISCGKLINALQAYVSVMNSKLDELDKSESDDESLIELVIDVECVSELSRSNRRKILEMMPVNETLKETNLNETEGIKASLNGMLQELKSVSSINARLSVDNYKSNSVERDLKLANSLRYYEPGSVCKVEKMYAIKTLMCDICATKMAFNEEFDALYATRDAFSNSVLESQVNARMLSQKLPSKAERDFWTAIVESSPSVTYLGSEIDDSDENLPINNNDTVVEAKKSIIEQLQSSTKIQAAFDTDINRLQLKRQFCDFSILGCEVKIYIMLLKHTVEDELSICMKDLRSSVMSYRKFVQEMRSMYENFAFLERKIEEMLLKLLKCEHSLSREINCISKKEFVQENELSKEHIENTLNRYFQDQRSSSLVSINPKMPILEDINIHKQGPSTTLLGLSEAVSRCQIFIPTQILIWHLKNLLLFVGEARQIRWDFCSKLEKNEKIMQLAIELHALLVSFCAPKFQDVLFVLDETMSLDDVSVLEKGFLNSLPALNLKFWRDIGQKTRKILLVKQRLQEIRDIFDKVKKLYSGLAEESYCLEQEHEKVCKFLKKRLGEAKQAFKTAKSTSNQMLKFCHYGS